MDTGAIIAILGGLGMFLLGIHHLTDGLKSLAGEALRRGMQKLVSGKWTGLVSGAVFTAVVQSSSAAILTLIGFVSAGLVTHTQALAVVLGANLGTTSTAWIVACFGLKVKISAAALPMLGVGGFLWLLGRGRLRAAGGVLAGFGLLFTGIGYLQEGMAGIEWNLDGLGGGAGGRWLLAGIGALMTLVMQSSSAAGATTLVAVATGALSVEQAFAMVVGQNIGTTSTALLAAVGGGLAVRRTAMAHVLFNLITGGVAMLFLDPLGDLARWIGGFAGDDPVITLAAFHTLFNLAGVLIFFPWLGFFSRGLERLVASRGISAVDRLGDTLAAAGGPVAMESAWRAMVELSRTAVGALRADLLGQPVVPSGFQDDLAKAGTFIHQLRVEKSDPPALAERRVRLWHALDHLRRLSSHLQNPVGGSPIPQADGVMEGIMAAMDGWIRWSGGAGPCDGKAAVEALQEVSLRFKAARQEGRLELLNALGSGGLGPEEAMERLDRIRWLDGVLYHLWRLADSLRLAAGKGSVEAL